MIDLLQQKINELQNAGAQYRRETQLMRLENLMMVNINTCGFRVCRDSHGFVDSFVVTDSEKLKSFAGDLCAPDRDMLLTFVPDEIAFDDNDDGNGSGGGEDDDPFSSFGDF